MKRRALALFILMERSLTWLLSEKIIQLERNAVSNAQYNRGESIEINLVPAAISNEELEDNACKALSLTGHEVIPDDLQVCHRLKKKRLWLQNSNRGNRNETFLLTGKIFAINQKALVN